MDSSLLNQVFTIGRRNDNKFVVPLPEVSGRHASIVFMAENTFLLEDLDSANGTFVNGVQVRKMVCNREDSIMIADTLFNIDQYFPNERIKAELKNNISNELKNLHNGQQSTATKPPPEAYIKTDPNDFTQEFYVLKDLYQQYQNAKAQFQRKQMTKSTFLRGIPGTLGMYGVPAALAFAGMTILPGVGMLLGFLGSVGGIVASNYASDNEKLVALDDEFKVYYCCPKCNFSFGMMPWEYWAKKKHCNPNCKAIWVN